MKQASMKMGNTKRRPTLPAAGEALRPCTARDPSRHTTMMNRHSLTHPSVDRKKRGRVQEASISRIKWSAGGQSEFTRPSDEGEQTGRSLDPFFPAGRAGGGSSTETMKMEERIWNTHACRDEVMWVAVLSVDWTNQREREQEQDRVTRMRNR